MYLRVQIGHASDACMTRSFPNSFTGPYKNLCPLCLFIQDHINLASRSLQNSTTLSHPCQYLL